MTTIGIPRALLYHKYKDLWISFFSELDCKVIISDKSNKKILQNGIGLALDEACLSLKLFLGHVHELVDRVDYVLIPRIVSLHKSEKLCTNFAALYDLVRNTINIPILEYNVDADKNITEQDSFIKMGLALGKTSKESKRAYLLAKKKEREKLYDRIRRQYFNLKSNYPKVLLVGHSYNLYDELIGKEIINYLEQNKVKVILSDIYNTYRVGYECSLISNTIYWTYNKEILGAVSHYKNYVDGIIILSTFPCGPDSLSNEMIIRKVKNIPTISLIIDELNNSAGLITRLESFCDIIKESKVIKSGKSNH